MDSRNNNFTLIRCIGAVLVFAGHMGYALGGDVPVFGGFFLDEIGVDILFVLGGYLITKSWLSDPNPLRYTIRRFFRLWIPFAVMVLSMVFIAGPLISDYGPEVYFKSWYTVYLRNLRFWIEYGMPGVFADLPIPYSVNVSLWTMPIEAALYVMTPLLLMLLHSRICRKHSFSIMTALTASMLGFDLWLRVFCADVSLMVYATDVVRAYHLSVFYVIGMLFTFEELKKYLNLQVGCLAVGILLLFQESGELFQVFALYLILPYFVFSFGLCSSPVFAGFGRRLEPSYGIYLYGFFFQQLVVCWQQRIGADFTYMQALLLSATPTFAAAALSYYLVEVPGQHASRYLTGKLKAIQSAGGEQ